MANPNELLNKLHNSEKSFKDPYDYYIKKCLDSTQVDDMKGAAEFKDIMAILHNKYSVPFLIEQLLVKGSSYFHECNLLLYNSLYQNNNEMLLSYTDIAETPELKETYLGNGADIAAFAITTAQYWGIQQEKNLEISSLCSC